MPKSSSAAGYHRRSLHNNKDDPQIPQKLYFKIGEVSTLVGVAPHVLRYWEKEFPFIKPSKSDSRHRRYRRRDVELFLEIKRLLYQELFTIAGARKYLQQNIIRKRKDAAGNREAPGLNRETLIRARAITQEIRDLLTAHRP